MKLTRQALKDKQIEDEDVVPVITPDGRIEMTFGVKIDGIWYYADSLSVPLSRLKCRLKDAK